MRERSMGYTANVDSDQSLLPHVVDNRLVAHNRLPNKDGEDFTTESEPNSPKILAKDLVQVHTRTGGHVSSMKTTEPEERSASNTDKLLQKQLRMGLFSIACSAAGFACYSFLSQPGIQGSLPKVLKQIILPSCLIGLLIRTVHLISLWVLASLDDFSS
jgi:hypothetical protein